jgi:hypothetical protein
LDGLHQAIELQNQEHNAIELQLLITLLRSKWKVQEHGTKFLPDIWPPEEWEASKILDQKTRNGVTYYLLLWMPSWVPEVHMSIVDGIHAGVRLHEEEWGISGIRETRMIMGMLHYLVEWLPSWVSELDAENASELIKEWYAT